MPPEGYDYNELLNKAKWKAYEQAQAKSSTTPSLIDCGELIEVNGEYVPAGMM